MDPSVWLADFRALHERARRNLLTSDERTLYLRAREELSRTLLAAQSQSLSLEAQARRSFRLHKGLPVDVCFRSAPLRSRTVDISSGGFSCMLPGAPRPGEPCGFTLWLPGEEGELVLGHARVVSPSQGEHGSWRVSFRLVEVGPEDRERLEMMLFDLALDYLGG